MTVWIGRGAGQGTGQAWAGTAAGGSGERGEQSSGSPGLPAGRALGQDVGARLVVRVQQLRAPQHGPLRQTGRQAGAELGDQGQALGGILIRVERHKGEVARHRRLLSSLGWLGGGGVSAVRHGVD